MAKRERKPRETRHEGKAKTVGKPTITDAQKAQVWTLREERQSLRKIADSVGIAPESVRRILNEDPARLEALVALHEEERAREHQQVENASVKLVLKIIETMDGLMFTATGKVSRRKLNDAEKAFLQIGSRWLGAVRLAGDGAVKNSQLLSGRATEILGRNDLMATMTPTDFVREAIDLNLVGSLPPAMREMAEKMQADMETQGGARH